MRDYAKVAPQFWIGNTGRLLRGHHEAQIVAFYLISSPHANMIGLFYMPLMFIAHETGLTIEGAYKGLQRCIEADFCAYDESSEMIWVYEMARYQISESLKPEDKRCAGVQNEYDNMPQNRFLAGFFDKYSESFNLKTKRENASPLQAPCKPHRSQEQEQEQEQEQDIKPTKKSSDRQKPETLIPENFTISENVRAWAKSNGHDNLDRHLENFIDSCRAKGYKYRDWDAAFRKAITSNWAKVPICKTESIFAGAAGYGA